MELIEAVGRFAPSPTGRMHFGNIFTALLSYASVRSRDGRWVLRIEDLDTQRSRREYALDIEDDLRWLGIIWDEGGTGQIGPHAPYCQSQRQSIYKEALGRLSDLGLLYTCTCRRADLLAARAPHASDGRVVYNGRCRPAGVPPFACDLTAHAAVRIFVPDETIAFNDAICGPQQVNLARHCGDFILRRADGNFAYQLAVVTDDADMGVNEVLRGNDLLLSSAQQIYLCRLLGYEPPAYVHTPLVVNSAGQRLSKRDMSMSMEAIRTRFTPREVIGMVACAAGLAPDNSPLSIEELITLYDQSKITRAATVVAPD